jgi:RimJ/RimL family protein N-acetyltransferase
MTHPDIMAAPAREQSGTFLAESEAEAIRRARQARRHRQPGRSLRPGGPPRLAAEGTPVRLRDGSAVLIRQVRSTDAPLLADGFTRLSPRSRQMRFLGAKTTLSAGELRYFTEVDHHDHEAIGALSAADGRGVGIARYVRDADDPQAAEIAVTIVDDWQGRGLGTELLSRLSDRARQAGIDRFTALAAAENAPVAGLARKLGACLAGRGPGTVEYEVALCQGTGS